MKTQQEIEQLAERWLAETPIKEWGGVENGYIKGYSQCQEDIEFGNKRMYSEEDMIDFAMFYYTHQGKATKYWGKDLFKEWFEQFKKK